MRCLYWDKIKLEKLEKTVVDRLFGRNTGKYFEVRVLFHYPLETYIQSLQTMAPTDDITSRVDSVDEDPTEKSNSELNKRLLAVEWHEDEEKRILRRLDFYLIPLVMIMFFTLNLDRYVQNHQFLNA